MAGLESGPSCAMMYLDHRDPDTLDLKEKKEASWAVKVKVKIRANEKSPTLRKS